MINDAAKDLYKTTFLYSSHMRRYVLLILEENRGRNLARLSGMKGGGVHWSTRNAARVLLALAIQGKRCTLVIRIAIPVLQTSTTADRNTFDSSMSGLHIKNAPCAHQDASNMDPLRIKVRRTHRFNQISSAKSSHPARPFGFASRESVFIHIDHLSRLSALGLDQPGTDVSDAQAFRRRDAQGKNRAP